MTAVPALPPTASQAFESSNPSGNNSGNAAATTVLEVSIACQAEQADGLGEMLWAVEGLLAITEDYRVDAEGVEQWNGLRVIIVHSAEVLQNLASLLETLPGFSPANHFLGEPKQIQPADWAESWKQFWHVQHITNRLTICPSWEEYTPTTPTETVLKLDPGSAFGTGTHETTRLMLRWLEDLTQGVSLEELNGPVLDLGTGSGILAIDAAKLGWRSITAIDIDPLAVTTAQENLTANQVSEHITVSAQPLEALPVEPPYRLILANILAPVIMALLPEITRRLALEGTLLASGIIASALPELQQALREAGYTQLEHRQEGPWFAIKATAPLVSRNAS
ncbi:MAG: 50S ribosomal protein L11 methyltransferase [Candidatus Melainabacteria bacterium]|nr:50S ribosomal protein L11 methyltransferase [Candidatus Melainabacteria bacterium]